MKGRGINLDKATNPKLAIKKLFQFMKPYYKLILLVVIFAVGLIIGAPLLVWRLIVTTG